MWDRRAVDTLDLLLHPVRLRIVHAMSGGRTRTTSDLCAGLPDVPKTTVYRHVGLLAEAGVLEVVDEQRVHGAVERHYRLRRERAVIDAGRGRVDVPGRAPSRVRRSHGRPARRVQRLPRPGRTPTRPPTRWATGRAPLWLTPDELAEMIGELRDVLASRTGNKPAPAAARTF